MWRRIADVEYEFLGDRPPFYFCGGSIEAIEDSLGWIAAALCV